MLSEVWVIVDCTQGRIAGIAEDQKIVRIFCDAIKARLPETVLFVQHLYVMQEAIDDVTDLDIDVFLYHRRV